MKIVTSTKKFVVKHKTAILATVAVTATTVAVLERVGISQHNSFLKEHDLYEAFYALVE